MSNWRMMWPRPAPSAERVASSRFRAVARISSRLATLAQAINSTSPTAPRARNRDDRGIADHQFLQQTPRRSYYSDPECPG